MSCVVILCLLHLSNSHVPLHMQIVFVGPFEHHSNLLPWREAGATVILIKENAQGLADIIDLEEKLKVSVQNLASPVLG